ncbi:MAG TPA: replicative DNA helicase [Gordonia sp. (in: high G+C Gram-positive bacteria)]|uniref:replicative DNA helicase n=1 Tax=unclassified Gordonia (in: high G+C Gram-positive bacteria) TaxID=2657482 RepID=UPI000FC0EF9B|nr:MULTISPECIES: replicative DNA helicase [unclassified Gordonia (in: high G+C Gram-positive bacteria)]RUP37414.1 MAG: replicative DNA helicase [Gordonia sp. (in: high G+C Gram-positive bacteria)]HNP57603.1 replicative DNA helicase [Gordonia sp. (in: high G+C Gram-positive bacteria)]HRC50232.1 replicative DNA helicase [Gordonia sp. (in: high G+C Gram-positive bacteria)]
MPDDLPNEEFGRQPPQDQAAEQSVLGGMMLSKDAIADVLEKIRPGDFYLPSHQAVYDAILDLFNKGEPADAVTVGAELERRGQLKRVGGAPYLHTLISTVPTAANAGFYAEIVAEKAILRRLVEAGTRIVQFGYAGGEGQDIAEVVDRAQAEVYDVTERRTSEDYLPLEELLQPTMDELDSIASRGGISLGVPTGFADLDKLTNGLHPGQMIIVAARPGVGKALALDTPLPTPSGWTTMGNVAVGDLLIGADGKPTKVVASTDVLTERTCYAVRFDDGGVLVADAEHQWQSQIDDHVVVATTEQLRPFVGCASVRNAEPLELPRRRFAYGPYTVGALAGMAFDDPEIGMRIDAEGEVDVLTLMADLGGQVPVEYLRGSIAQRRALLAGILDARAIVEDDGRITVAAATRHMTFIVGDLVAGLGYTYRRLASGWLSVEADDDVFTVHHKAVRHKELRRPTHSRRIVAITPVPSVPVRCVQVDNPDHLYLAGEAMVPTHNSTLALDFLRSCSIHHGLTGAMFSLEMSKNEIVMRLLSAEAKVKLADMRAGSMSDDDWTRLARRMGEISEAPLFIDDSPNLTMMEIRAKARRLKQRHDLKMVVVDYMQLMTSGKKVESRQQEVSEFSRSLKLLAKELEVPVIAISQLNRGPEQRTDKRPQVSDLRESGCLPASTRILRADTGAQVTLGELMESGEQPLVWSLDERMRMVARPMVKVFPSGRKEVFRLRLASGRIVEATGNHPFMTVDGWIALEDLKVGDRVAAPRSVPEPAETKEMANDELVMLAHMIGDGSCVKRQPLRYASVDEANLSAVTIAAKAWGVEAVRDDYEAARVTTLRLPAPYHLTHGKRNPIAKWLDELGLFGLRSYEKFVPEPVFMTPNSQVALFLHHLWATDGSVRWDAKLKQARIYYATTSRRLADDVCQLLARHGIYGRVIRTAKSGYRPCWNVQVSGLDNQMTFLTEIGVHGDRGVKAAECLVNLAGVVSNTNTDTVPAEVWTKVRELLADRGMTHRQFAAAMGSRFCGSTMWKHSPSRSRLARVAQILDDSDIEMLATNDVYWDRIVEVTSIGEQDVFDGTVPGTHNFVADGVSVHNSLEQDADMVILLHRPDAIERDDPRAGEADIIVGKHRNGPTQTITVAHQLHLSRFVDMARD